MKISELAECMVNNTPVHSYEIRAENNEVDLTIHKQRILYIEGYKVCCENIDTKKTSMLWSTQLYRTEEEIIVNEITPRVKKAIKKATRKEDMHV